MVCTELSRKGMLRRLCLSYTCQILPLVSFKSSHSSCPYWLSTSVSFFRHQKLKMCIQDMFGASVMAEYITVKLLFKIMKLDGVYFFTKTFHQMVIMMLFEMLCTFTAWFFSKKRRQKFKCFVRIPSLFSANMLSPHTPQPRLMDLTNMWQTDAFTYRNYTKSLCSWGTHLARDEYPNRHICKQGYSEALGSDTKRLPPNLRQHLDTTFCSDHVSIIKLLTTQSSPDGLGHPQTCLFLHVCC